jgi:hypothetical protein
MRRIAAVGLVVALAVGASACGADDGDVNAGNVEGRIAQRLTEGDDGFDEDTADCIASAVTEEIGADRLAELYGDEPEDPPDEVQDAIIEATPACFDMGSIVESIPN